MKTTKVFFLLLLAAVLRVVAQTDAEIKTGTPALIPPKPNDAFFQPYDPKPAPQPAGLVLRRGDRLAICGDSITEQKMYSRIMETYLTVCVPEFGIQVRQYGWGGETAPGFLRRMTNDCLRFHPTIATTCYGMNDHGYRAYEQQIGDRYRAASLAIVQSFKTVGALVIQGSPGCVGARGPDRKTGSRPPGWDEAGIVPKNINLCTLRNIGIGIAIEENEGFADVFWPMLTGGFEARKRYNPNYAIAGGDGVHPDWAGHLVMAYSFLHAMGLTGRIGTFNVDLKSGEATVSDGHQLLAAKDGTIEIKSVRYPFCASGDVASDHSIRSGMTLVPFNSELNRLTLVARNGSAKNYKVTWGNGSRTYTSDQLEHGVNLADDFADNPFSAAFKAVDAAVAAKQSYETKEIKVLFHDLVAGKFVTDEKTGQIVIPPPAKSTNAPTVIKDAEIVRLMGLRHPDGTFDRNQIALEAEHTREPLVAAVKQAFVPVTHTIRIEAQ